MEESSINQRKLKHLHWRHGVRVLGYTGTQQTVGVLAALLPAER